MPRNQDKVFRARRHSRSPTSRAAPIAKDTGLRPRAALDCAASCIGTCQVPQDSPGNNEAHSKKLGLAFAWPASACRGHLAGDPAHGRHLDPRFLRRPARRSPAVPGSACCLRCTGLCRRARSGARSCLVVMHYRRLSGVHRARHGESACRAWRRGARHSPPLPQAPRPSSRVNGRARASGSRASPARGL